MRYAYKIIILQHARTAALNPRVREERGRGARGERNDHGPVRRSVTRVDPEGSHARRDGTVAVPHPGRRRQEIVQGAQLLARAAGERPIRAVVRDADGVRPARERPRLDDDGRGVGRPRPVVVGRERDEERHERRVVREEDRQARAVESCA